MLSRLKTGFASLVDIRPGEGAKVVLLALYFFLLITSYYVIKPVRNSLFIQRLGADNLPWVYILAAIFVSLVIFAYAPFADRIDRRTLIVGTLAFLASNLLFFWWLLDRGGLLSSGAFYIWGKLYPLLVVSQFWLLANVYFTTPQAKRSFGLIGTGGIVGGITGSVIAGWFATLVGSERLLLVSAGVLAVCAALVLLIDRILEPVPTPAASRRKGDATKGAWGSIRDSKHLRTISLILGLTLLVSTLIDWQFSKAVELFIPSEDGKTAFFGRFFTFLNVASVLIQFFITSWILRVFGVGVALLLLPLGLLTGSIGIIVHPGLWTTAFTKGAEGALRYSLDQSTRELLFLPLPLDVKLRVKPMIDLVVYRGGTGLAGIVLLVGTRAFDFGLREMAFLVTGFVAVWIGLTVVMRREFRASVKQIIRTRDVEADELLVRHLDAATRDELIAALESDDKDTVLFSQTLLEGLDEGQIVRRADKLLNHPSEEVRRNTVRILHEADAGFYGAVEEHLPLARRLLSDPPVAVRLEAVRFVDDFSPEGEPQVMSRLLTSTDLEARTAASAPPFLRDRAKPAVDTIPRRVEGSGSDEFPGIGATPMETDARSVGDHRSAMESILVELLHNSDHGAQLAAIQAAGRSANPNLIPHLMSKLCCSHAREAARASLAAFGPSAFPDLKLAMERSDIPLDVRTVIPSIHYEVGGQPAVDALTDVLPGLAPAAMRRAVLKRLGRMRRNYRGLRFDRTALESFLRVDLAETYQFLADRWSVGSEGLLARVLRDQERRGLERASRVLGLLYPQADILAAYQGLTSEDAGMQAAGLELLDSTLSIGHRRMIMPLADEDLALEERVRRARGAFPRVRVDDLGGVLARLSALREFTWLAAVARVEGGLQGPHPSLVPVADPYHEHVLPRVRVSFRALLAEEDPGMVLKLVERADFLRDVSIFSQLSTEDLARIAAISQEKVIDRGERLYSEGEQGSELFLIVSGKVEATRSGEVEFVADRGGTVGALSLIDERPRERTVTAVSQTRVLTIARDDFFELMRDRFNLAEGLLVHLARIARNLTGSAGEGDPTGTVAT